MSQRAALLVAVGALLVSGCIDSAAKSFDGEPAKPSKKLHELICNDTLKGIDLQRATILDLQDAMEKGRLTSVDLVEAFYQRILALDEAGPKVNSIRVINPKAWETAEQLDEERRHGIVRGPLHGIPILLKDNVGTDDLPTTAGSIALANNKPVHDATITERLREAGAVIFGKAEMAEFANWMATGTMPNGYSSLGGQVIAPYTGGNPSGSSSGSGVSATMAFTGGAIGSETSGSIIGPAVTNSVVGLKTTMGLLSRAGVIPLAENFDVVGPMVRNVEDAAAMLGAMVGPDPLDDITATSEGELPPGNDYVALLRTDLTGVRIAHAPGTNVNYTRALNDLRALNATLVAISSADHNTAMSIYLSEFALVSNEFKYGLNDYLLRTPRQEDLPFEVEQTARLGQGLTGIILYNQQNPDKIPYGQHNLVASNTMPGVKESADITAIPTIESNKAFADELFRKYDADAFVAFGFGYYGMGTAAGYPSLAVPAGYSGRTPQGITFTGPAFSDGDLLGIAYAYEQSTHRREPPGVRNPTLLAGVCPLDLPGKSEPGADPKVVPAGTDQRLEPGTIGWDGQLPWVPEGQTQEPDGSWFI